jgi:hypothetical protein
MAFSPSVDLEGVATRGITPPTGEETLQLDASAAHDFLASAMAGVNPLAADPAQVEIDRSRSTSASNSADARPDRVRPPSRPMTESDDLFSVAANSGMITAGDRLPASSSGERRATPPHISDARRTPPGAGRQIAIVVSVILLLAALSVLGLLIYQEFTGGPTEAPAPTREVSG